MENESKESFQIIDEITKIEKEIEANEEQLRVLEKEFEPLHKESLETQDMKRKNELDISMDEILKKMNKIVTKNSLLRHQLEVLNARLGNIRLENLE